METYDYDMDIVAMSKQELAQMYAPDLTPHAAVNRFSFVAACGIEKKNS